MKCWMKQNLSPNKTNTRIVFEEFVKSFEDVGRWRISILPPEQL